MSSVSRCQHQPSSRSSLQPSVASANVNGNGQLQRGSPAWHMVGAALLTTRSILQPLLLGRGMQTKHVLQLYNAGMRKRVGTQG